MSLGGAFRSLELSVVDRAEAVLFGAHSGDAGEEGLGVGVLGRVEDVLDRALLDDFTAEHYEDAVGDILDDAEVVSDEDEAHAEAAAEFGEELHDLFLDGDVEGGGGFVSDEELGAATEGHGDHDALLHAAGEFVGIGAEAFFGFRDADLAQPGDDLSVLVFNFGSMKGEGFGELGADGEDGVEGGGGFLENIGDVTSAHAAELAFVELEDVVAGYSHLASRNERRGFGQETCEGQCGGALAATTFADDGDGLTGHHGKVDALDGFGRFGSIAFEADAEILDLKQGRGFRRHRDAGGE